MPELPVDVNRLCAAVQHSRMAMRRGREERREFVRELVGGHWSEEGARVEVPVNLLSLYQSVVLERLIADDPQFMLSTFERPYRSTVAAMQDWGNREIKRMGLGKTLGRCVIDAGYSLGICKVAIATPGEAAASGWGETAGRAFAAPISHDDFVYSTNAKDFREAELIGHRYRIPKDAAVKWIGKRAKLLTVSSDPIFNHEGDERLKVLGRGMYGDQQEVEDMVDLWEIYLPRHRLVVTLADDQLAGPMGAPDRWYKNEPLLVQKWIGPETGPYHFLGFGTVPDNAMPLAPVHNLFDLQKLENDAWRKIARSIRRIKELTVYQAGASADAKRIMDASDGEMVQVNGVDNVKPVVYNGQATQLLAGLATQVKLLFNDQAGNMEVLGGRSQQAKTAHQEEILNSNAQAGTGQQQARADAFAASVVNALCWYWHHDPLRTYSAPYSPPGMQEVSAMRHVTPSQRARVPWEALKVDVNVYAMQPKTPASRLAVLQSLLQEMVPIMPLLQQSGIMFDPDFYLQKVGEYRAEPDVSGMFTLREPPAEPDAAGGNHQRTLPPNTERTYNRVNTSERTQQGTETDMAARMMGHDLGGSPSKNGQLVGA